MTTITYRDVSIDTDATLVDTGVVVGSETRTTTISTDVVNAEHTAIADDVALFDARHAANVEFEAAEDVFLTEKTEWLEEVAAVREAFADDLYSAEHLAAIRGIDATDYHAATLDYSHAAAEQHLARVAVTRDESASEYDTGAEARAALDATPEEVTVVSHAHHTVVVRDFSFDANADTVYTAIDELLDNGGTSSISLRDFEAATGLDDVLVYDSADGEVQFASTVNGMDIRDFNIDTFRSDEGLDTVTEYMFVNTVTGEEYIDGKVYLKDDTHNMADGSVMWNLASGKYTVEELEALTGVDINEAAGDYDHNGTIDLDDYNAYIFTTNTSANANGDIAVHLVNDEDSSDFSVLGSHFFRGDTSDNTSIGGESYTAIVMGDLVDVTVTDMVDFISDIKGYDYIGDFDFVAIEDTATIM